MIDYYCFILYWLFLPATWKAGEIGKWSRVMLWVRMPLLCKASCLSLFVCSVDCLRLDFSLSFGHVLDIIALDKEWKVDSHYASQWALTFFIFRTKWQSVENVYYKLCRKSGRFITLSIIYLIPSFLVHCLKHNSYINKKNVQTCR